MTTFQTVLYEKQRNGVLITLNRPETLNAISRNLEHDIAAALTEAEADPEVRAIVLTGAGRAFSSGYDMAGGRGETRMAVRADRGHERRRATRRMAWSLPQRDGKAPPDLGVVETRHLGDQRVVHGRWFLVRAGMPYDLRRRGSGPDDR